VALSRLPPGEHSMTEGKVREKNFNLHTWFATIPMTDDVYLGLQAQNLARVEMSVVRRYESKALDEQHADPGSFQGPIYRELMALSQMWVFGVYEFLRTWRQRATELIGFEDTLNSLATQEERDAYLKKITDDAKRGARLAENAPVYYPNHVAKVGDAAFMKSVRDYRDKTKDLFRELSAVRMPAAKHEVPGKKGVLAEAPGIGLVNPCTGSIRWQVLVGEEKSTIERRDLADKFLGILGWHEDIETALSLAKEAKARRKRLRRETRRRAARKPRAEPLDEFFRTEKEAKDDEKPVVLTQRRKTQQEIVRAAKAGPQAKAAPPGRKVLEQAVAPREPLPYFVKDAAPPPKEEKATQKVKRRYPRG
jgi:hypothetical protein